MALCSDCRTVIPCHCHLTPPVQIRPGVYLATKEAPVNPGGDATAHAQTHGEPT